MGAIVEGHGDARALPVLIRRIAAECDVQQAILIDPILRVPASSLKKEGILEGEIENAARKLKGSGGILVLLDCDWDNGCPKFDGPAWLKRAREARPDMPIALVLAQREYEAWFIAAAESLRGQRGLARDMIADSQPEDIRNAKGWLSDRMPPGCPYSPTTDQPALTALFDMAAARRNTDSFDKCYREIAGILRTLKDKTDA